MRSVAKRCIFKFTRGVGTEDDGFWWEGGETSTSLRKLMIG